MDDELKQLIDRLKQLRPDLVVVPRDLAELHFWNSGDVVTQAMVAYQNQEQKEAEEARRAAAASGGHLSYVSQALEIAFATAIETFEQHGGLERYLTDIKG